MPTKSAPVPASEDAPVIEDAVIAAPTTSHFVGVHGITDGMNHYGKDDHFVGSEALLAHYERTGGFDGNRQLYRPITEADYTSREDARLEAIRTPDVPDLPLPVARDQVTENAFSSLELPSAEPPIFATPNSASTVENGMATSSGSA